MLPIVSLSFLCVFTCQAPLLAPTVGAPISPCSRHVQVVGQLPNAQVSLYVGDTVLVTQGTTNGVALIALPSALVPGAKISATQTVAGTEGPRSPLPIVVQPVPTILGGMVPISHLYGCATSTYLEGAVPGAGVLVSQNGSVIGKGEAIDGTAWIFLTKAITAGQSLELTQTACSLSSGIVLTPKADSPPLTLPVPRIAQPIVACQPSIFISEIVDGARVKVFRDGSLDGDWHFAVGSLWYPMGDKIQAGVMLSAEQTMKDCERQPSTSTPVTAVASTSLPTPSVLGPLCSGGNLVTVTGLIPGSIVTLYRKGQSLGSGEAPSSTFAFWVPALMSGDAISATQKSCGIESKASTEITVQNAGQSKGKLSLYSPLHECASRVSLVNVIPGSTVYIETRRHGNVSGYHQAFSGDVVLPVSPSLEFDDEVKAVMIGCGGMTTETASQKVQHPPAMTPPQVAPPVAGDSTVLVFNVINGAWVDLYEDGAGWLGTAFVTGNAWVALPAPAVMGQVLRARQRMCSSVSEFSQPVTVLGPLPFGPMLLAPDNDSLLDPGSVVLSWTDHGAGGPRAATQYEVRLGEGGVLAPVSTVQTLGAPQTTYTVPNLKHNASYVWQIRAKNSFGDGYSVYHTFRTKVAPVPAATSDVRFVGYPYLSLDGVNVEDHPAAYTEISEWVGIGNYGNANASDVRVLFRLESNDPFVTFTPVDDWKGPFDLAAGASQMLSSELPGLSPGSYIVTTHLYNDQLQLIGITSDGFTVGF